MNTNKANKRQAQLTEAMNQIEKRFGQGAILQMDGSVNNKVPHLPTGIVSLDAALGIGGLPKGRIIEIYGPESSGKTTLTLQVIAQGQKQGMTCAFIDSEHALDPGYARSLGVQVEQLLVAQPSCGEEALDIAEILSKSGGVELIVIDSVAALTPRAEIEGSMGDQHVGLQARLMSRALRKLTGATSNSNTTLVFINQIRHKIGVTFGSNETTPGGNALKFYSSVRLDIRRIGAIKEGEEIVGNKTRIKVAKNKMAPPFRKVDLELYYGDGLCPAADLLESALQAGLLNKRGSYYRIGDQPLAQGRVAARRRLKEDPALFEKLSAALRGDPTDEQDRPQTKAA